MTTTKKTKPASPAEAIKREEELQLEIDNLTESVRQLTEQLQSVDSAYSKSQNTIRLLATQLYVATTPREDVAKLIIERELEIAQLKGQG